MSICTSKPILPFNPALWGIFFEDINLGADGGLHAEFKDRPAPDCFESFGLGFFEYFHLKYLGVGNEQWGSPYVDE